MFSEMLTYIFLTFNCKVRSQNCAKLFLKSSYSLLPRRFTIDVETTGDVIAQLLLGVLSSPLYLGRRGTSNLVDMCKAIKAPC